jgi:hypothetical protein
MYFAFKTLISALIIAGVTQLSEKTPTLAAFLKSLPITSFMVFFLMKIEGRTNTEMANMSWDILWLVIPSLLLFIIFPLLINKGLNFYASIGVASIVMGIGYAITLKLMT